MIKDYLNILHSNIAWVWYSIVLIYKKENYQKINGKNVIIMIKYDDKKNYSRLKKSMDIKKYIDPEIIEKYEDTKPVLSCADLTNRFLCVKTSGTLENPGIFRGQS